MRERTAHAPAAKPEGSTHPTTIPPSRTGNRGCVLSNPRRAGLASGRLFRQIGKKETGNAILVAALLFIQHPGIIASQERGLLFGLGSRDEKPASDAG